MSEEIVTKILKKRDENMAEVGLSPIFLVCDKETYKAMCLFEKGVSSHFRQVPVVVVSKCEGGFEYVLSAPYQYIRLTTGEYT